MEIETVSDVSQKGITRLVSRFQREFSLEQTPHSLILQSEKVRDLTIALMTMAARSPDRLGVFLSVISGMADIGIIYDMDTAVSETRRLMSKLSIVPSSVSRSDTASIVDPIVEPAPQINERETDRPRTFDNNLFDEAPTIRPQAVEKGRGRQVRIGKPASPAIAEDAEKKEYGQTFEPGMSKSLPEKPGQWISPKDKPQADIGMSLSEDSITCLHCGEQFTMIKRHIERQHRQTPDDYRAYWGLPPDYPMAAINYTQLKREEAKGTGLGTYSRDRKVRKKVSAR